MGDSTHSRQLNCWEFMECGRGPSASENGNGDVCSAARATPLDGVHGGFNGGRACWALAGTECHGRLQDTFAQKDACIACPFYALVTTQQAERGLGGIVYTPKLRQILAEET